MTTDDQYIQSWDWVEPILNDVVEEECRSLRDEDKRLRQEIELLQNKLSLIKAILNLS